MMELLKYTFFIGLILLPIFGYSLKYVLQKDDIINPLIFAIGLWAVTCLSMLSMVVFDNYILTIIITAILMAILGFIVLKNMLKAL